jgi:uncharacterized protein YaeQ
MSFIDRFISFTCELSLVERHIHERARKKLPRHEKEEPEQFYAKVVAAWYLHRPSLVIASEPVDETSPRISSNAPEGYYELWADVGEASPRKLRAAVRLCSASPRQKGAEIYHFFYDDNHLSQLLSALRGSTENWVEKINFVRLDPALLDYLIEHETTSQNWSFTMPDEQTLYLAVDGNFFVSSIEEISIWDAFQKSLKSDQIQ